ncbi:ulp1 protease family, C-terminal catalytic domain-containing protein, partial [Tanacetum coccineum]
GVNAEKDGVNVVQEDEADVNEEPEDILEKRNFHADDLFVWPRAVLPITVVCPQTPQRVVTRSSLNKSIVKPSTYLTSPYMNKRTKVIPLIKRLEFVLGNNLFAMQGDKYETVFQTRYGHDLSSVRLNMETLAPRLWIDANVIDYWVAVLNHEELVRGVFPICASGHFYVVVFHLKSPSAMIILDNNDCGETYNSKYKAVCEPLAHEVQDCYQDFVDELNVDAEKMFDLAFKFETENNEQTRISIIVNAIKNRDERNPAKTKTLVENQEEDALKNKCHG